MTVTFQQDLPADVPASLPVLVLEEPTPFPASLVRLIGAATSLGLDVGHASVTVSIGDPWTSLRVGPDEVAMHARSQAVRVARATNGNDRRALAFEVADEQAVAAATDLVARLGVPKDEIGQPSISHLRVAGRTVGGEPIAERVLDTEIAFPRVLDGVAVGGPGGMVSVRVDGSGSVARSLLVWRGVRAPASTVRIRRPGHVRDVFERAMARKRGDVTVTSASFGYFELGPDDRQSYLQPAYTLIYEVRDGDVVYRSAAVHHAGDRVFERLAGPRRYSTGPAPAQPPATVGVVAVPAAAAVAKPAARAGSAKSKPTAKPKAKPGSNATRSRARAGAVRKGT